MKRLLLLIVTIITLGIGDTCAETVTWTPGVAFNESTAGNFSTGWFSVVVPITGTLNSFTVNLGTGSGNYISRADAYLAISRNLKSSTTGFGASDFVAISTNTCGTTLSKITMNFSSDAVLEGGATYYYYWVTKSGEVYTTINERYYVVSASNMMSVNTVGNTTAYSNAYVMPFSATMTIADNKYYRIKALYPDDICYLYSNASNEDKIWKSTTAPSVTASRYIWKATLNSGLILQNIGSSRYIPKLTAGSKTGADVNYLTATTAEDAEKFELQDNNPASSNKPGYIALKSTTTATDTWLNTATSGNAYVGMHNANNNKSGQFLFQQVKTVTFSTAVSVNGGDAVSTIYVATDGSDADNLNLPTTSKYTIGGTEYFAAEAAKVITAAGTDDIEVTVSSAMITSLSQLSNDKCYTVVTASRGGWAVANGGTQLTRTLVPSLNIAYSATDSKQQFAFIYYDGTDDDTDNGAYYLYSVSAKKFITAAGTSNNSVLNLTSLASQSVTFIESGVSGYPICVEMSNTGDLNVRTGDYEPGVVIYGTSGYYKTDGGNAVAICEVGDFDATEALATWNTLDVTYTLQWNDGSTTTSLSSTVADVVVNDCHENVAASEYVPSTFENDFVTLSYDPATITSSTTTVTVTASWSASAPFQLSASYAAAKWYTIGMRTENEDDNHIWKYNSSNSDKIETETVARDAYASVTSSHLFCFVGDPYSGFTIYNKSAGSSKSLNKVDDGSTQASMSTTGSLFIPKASSVSGKTIANGYSCFVIKDGDNYLNCNDSKDYGIYGWSGDGWSPANGGGSTCWFLPEGQYYLTYLNSLLLTPPANAVGTSSYITTEEAKTIVINHKASLEQDLFYLNDDNRMSIKTILNGIKRSGTNALTDGYYRLVNAYPNWTTTNPCVYYDSEADRMKWSKASNASDNVNSIVKLTTETPSIYTPNGQKYMKLARTDNADQLGNEAATTSFTSLGDAQYNITVGGQVLHTQGHSNGTGSADVLVGFSGSANTASSWYLVKVTSLPITLNDGGDDYYYATLYLPFDATISGATAYTMRQSGNWLIPTEVENNKVPAGTPVLLRGTSASATATINTGDAFSSLSGLDANFTGTYTEISTARATGEYILSKKDGVVGFYQRGTGKKILANRAYLQLDEDISEGGEIKGFYLDFDGIATNMNGIENVPSGTDAIYNIAGQRVKAAQKGLYIIDGKKVLVK